MLPSTSGPAVLLLLSPDPFLSRVLQLASSFAGTSCIRTLDICALPQVQEINEILLGSFAQTVQRLKCQYVNSFAADAFLHTLKVHVWNGLRFCLVVLPTSLNPQLIA